MSRGPVHIVATLSPREGKVDRLIELLTEAARFVKENEPNTLSYHFLREINKKTGVEELIVLERYKDMAAVKVHASSKESREMGKKVKDEDLVTAPTKVVLLKAAGGFESRL